MQAWPGGHLQRKPAADHAHRGDVQDLPGAARADRSDEGGGRKVHTSRRGVLRNANVLVGASRRRRFSNGAKGKRNHLRPVLAGEVEIPVPRNADRSRKDLRRELVALPEELGVRFLAKFRKRRGERTDAELPELSGRQSRLQLRGGGGYLPGIRLAFEADSNGEFL